MRCLMMTKQQEFKGIIDYKMDEIDPNTWEIDMYYIIDHTFDAIDLTASPCNDTNIIKGMKYITERKNILKIIVCMKMIIIDQNDGNIVAKIRYNPIICIIVNAIIHICSCTLNTNIDSGNKLNTNRIICHTLNRSIIIMFRIRYYDKFDVKVNEINYIYQIAHEINNFVITINVCDLILNQMKNLAGKAWLFKFMVIGYIAGTIKSGYTTQQTNILKIIIYINTIIIYQHSGDIFSKINVYMCIILNTIGAMHSRRTHKLRTNSSSDHKLNQNRIIQYTLNTKIIIS